MSTALNLLGSLAPLILSVALFFQLRLCLILGKRIDLVNERVDLVWAILEHKKEKL
jgi:hypothetical protein